jgi:hypothetical protein
MTHRKQYDKVSGGLEADQYGCERYSDLAIVWRTERCRDRIAEKYMMGDEGTRNTKT